MFRPLFLSGRKKRLTEDLEKTLALSEKAMTSEPLEEASAAVAPAVAAEVCFPDDLLLLDFPSADAKRPPAATTVGSHQGLLFEDILDPSVDSLTGLAEVGGGGGGGDEEEELEWLSNKDAFPTLETSFEIPSQSRSSSDSAAAATEGPSPVSILMAAAASFAVPVRARSKGCRRRGRVPAGLSPGPARVTPAARRAAAAAAERRRCRHCGAEVTPQWRAGPEGPKTLCNACGVRYKSGRLVPEYRPASSPTFSPAIHSNSHRRILEMRRRKVTSGRRSSRPTPPNPLSSPAM